MRIKLKKILNKKLGDKKVKVKFLFFPKIIGRELRWLEFVKIEYTYQEYMVSYDMGGVTEIGWIVTAWMPYDPVKDCSVYINEGCAHIDGILCDINNCSFINKHTHD